MGERLAAVSARRLLEASSPACASGRTAVRFGRARHGRRCCAILRPEAGAESALRVRRRKLLLAARPDNSRRRHVSDPRVGHHFPQSAPHPGISALSGGLPGRLWRVAARCPSGSSCSRDRKRGPGLFAHPPARAELESATWRRSVLADRTSGGGDPGRDQSLLCGQLSVAAIRSNFHAASAGNSLGICPTLA